MSPETRRPLAVAARVAGALLVARVEQEGLEETIRQGRAAREDRVVDGDGARDPARAARPHVELGDRVLLTAGYPSYAAEIAALSRDAPSGRVR